MQVIDATIFRYLTVIPTRYMENSDSNLQIDVQMTNINQHNENETTRIESEPNSSRESIYDRIFSREVSYDMKMRLIAQINQDDDHLNNRFILNNT